MAYFAAIAFLLALAASIDADGSLGNLVYAPGHASADYYTYPRYAFEYAVRDPHTGDNKAQWEKRDGDLVIGAYSLVEPDGSLRVVEYRADDKTGFNAVVKRIGPNIHPVATPIYKASIPSLGYKSYLPQPIGLVAGLEKLAGAPLYNGAYSGSATSGLLYKSIAPAIIQKVAPIYPLGKIIQAPVSVPAPLYNAQIIPEPIYKGPILPIYKVPNPQVAIPQVPISQIRIPQVPISQVRIPQIPIPQVPMSQIRNPQIPIPQVPISQIQIPQVPISQVRIPQIPIPRVPISQIPIPQVPIYKGPIYQKPYGPAASPQPILRQAPLLREPIYSSYLGKSGIGLPELKNLEPTAYRGIDYNLLGKGLLDYGRLIGNKAPLGYRDILEHNAPLVYKGYTGPGLGYRY